MTVQTAAVAPAITPGVRGRPFLGFGTFLRKELTEWARGRGALVIAGISIFGAIFTTVIPFISPQGQGQGLVLSMDPTTNMLLGWGGMTAAVVALLATMSLISGERDRGTLSWTLSKPISPVSVVAAKWTAAMAVFGLLGVVIPLAVSCVVATVAYGAPPNLQTVALFGVLYLTVPAFYIALTVALGTVVRSTGGVAGIGFAVLLVPNILAGAVPALKDYFPTAIGGWALATATGQEASIATPIAWGVTMLALAIGAAVAFSREEV